MSEAFIVSARKYRPQRFDEVVGQDSTTTTLKNAISGKQLAHAFLFCGSRGVGKTTIARIFAKTINCKSLQADGEACNTCDSCVTFNSNSSFNIIELDAASKNSVEDIRHIVEQVQYPPQNAEYKIFIVDEVHMLSSAAFNAFLKTLEEPPAYAKFILATTEKHKILPTILSRCQIYDFKRISIADIEAHLRSICQKENIIADDNSLNLIAQKADGGLRDALSMFDRLVSMNDRNLNYQSIIQNLNILDHEIYFKFLNQIQAEKSDELLLLLNEVLSQGFDIDTFLTGFAEHIRNVWVAKKDNTLELLEVSQDAKHKFVDSGKLIDEPTLLNILQIISDCEVQLKSARNRRFTIELALLKMSYLKKIMNTQWSELGEKKKSDGLVRYSNENETKVVVSIPITQDLKPTTNKGIKLDDIINQVKIEKIAQASKTYIEIDPDTIWNIIVENFKGDPVELHVFDNQIPKYLDHRFIFSVDNQSYAMMLDKLFLQFKAIYKDLTNYESEWIAEINQVIFSEESITRKQSFDELKLKYPILEQINSSFKLDFNS